MEDYKKFDLDPQTRANLEKAKQELGKEGQKTESPTKFVGEMIAEDIGATAHTIKEKIFGSCDNSTSNNNQPNP